MPEGPVPSQNARHKGAANQSFKITEAFRCVDSNSSGTLGQFPCRNASQLGRTHGGGAVQTLQILCGRATHHLENI